MGKFPVLDGNDEKRQQLRIAQQLIDEYIEDCIPYIEKTAYLEALEKSPHLIAIETDPSWFLMHEKWNIWSAAQRIVKYWEWKRALFGDVRAFLPICDFSGNGALNDIDMQLIRSGTWAILPKDDRGNVYVIFNRSRAGEPPPWESDVRIGLRGGFFYFIFCLRKFYCDHIFDEGTGVIVINMIYTLAPNPTINFPDMINDAMPIRVVRVHHIFYRTEGNSLIMEKYIVPSFLAMNAPLLRRITNCVFHYCSSQMEARSKLQQYGIPLECIPTFLGGSWSYDFFDDWFDRFSNENTTVSQNEMQPIILEEHNTTDTSNGSDLECIPAPLGLWLYDVFDDCNENETIIENEIQHHRTQNEIPGADAFVEGDGLCHELNDCSLDHISVLNQIAFNSFVCSENLQAASSLDDTNTKLLSDVDNKWQTEVHSGVTNQKLIPAVDNARQIQVHNGVTETSSTASFISNHPVIDKNEFCDLEQFCAHSNQSVTTNLSIPIAKAANNILFENFQDSPAFLNIGEDVICNDAKVVSLLPMRKSCYSTFFTFTLDIQFRGI